MLFIIPTVNTHRATLVPDNQIKKIYFYFTINEAEYNI